jgi:hypothetical protein
MIDKYLRDTLMLKNLPLSLLQVAQDLVETQDVLESCVACGAVVGTCIHSNLIEDGLSALNLPDENEPEQELSGEVDDLVINPEYQTFSPRRS